MDLRENFVIRPESTSCKIVNFLLETRNRKKKKKGLNLNPMNSKKYHLPLLFVAKRKRKKRSSNRRNLFRVIAHRFHTETHKGQVQAMAVISKDSQDTNSATDPLLSWLWYSLSLSLSLSEAFKQTHYWLFVVVVVCV